MLFRSLELKDEFTEEEEEEDVWASTDSIMDSLKEEICDVKASQTDSLSHKTRDETRKSRNARKISEETLGNPDSGKENEEIVKKPDKNHSPVSKRRKISNRRYFNEEFEDSNSKKSSKRSSIDSIKSDSSRGRSLSTSTDEGSECDLKKSEKISLLYSSSKSKKIKLIEPSPIDPESKFQNLTSSSNKKKDATSSRDSGKERRKSDEKSVKHVTNKPSKILKYSNIDIFDKEYEKARKPSSKKAKF